jgi:ubiquinone/menaquinone biosynthesis C-methylase UbiE
MDALYTLLSRLENDQVVLDLGCGHGSFHYEACRARIVAMDLVLLEQQTLRPQAAYVRADSSAIPLPDASVDAVISHHTLEHFLDYKKTLAEIRRILSPNGWFWIAVPNGYGFDDALYRFLFAGGGHVNRFQYESLVAEVENVTGTRLARSCDLFSSFVYLKRPGPDELQHFPARTGFLGEMPQGFLTFGVLALNVGTRLLDKLIGSRFSRYGWGFLFVRMPMPIDEMPSYFNVCRQCGSGNAAAEVKTAAGRSFLSLRRYNCPHCGEINILVSPPPNLQ